MGMSATAAVPANATYRAGPLPVGRRVALSFTHDKMTGALTGANEISEWNYDFTPQNSLKISSLSATKTIRGIDPGASSATILTVGLYPLMLNSSTGAIEEDAKATAQVVFSNYDRSGVPVFAGEKHFAGVLDKQAQLAATVISIYPGKDQNKTDNANKNYASFSDYVGFRLKIYAKRTEVNVDLYPSVMVVCELFETPAVTIDPLGFVQTLDQLGTVTTETIMITEATA